MKNRKGITLGLACLLIFLLVNSSYAAQRIFYEDCEDTSFSEYFLERHFGSDYQSYWNELTSELTRSTTAHRGSYSMTYDPFSAGNPHARIGTPFAYGNTSNFNLRDHDGRYWYFRWYQRWEPGINWGGYLVKMIYVNRQPVRDFTHIIAKTGSGTWLSTLKDYDTYGIRDNKYGSMVSTDDGQWHKMELLLDVGTTGANNGRMTFIVDDQVSYDKSGLRYNGTIRNNPVGSIAIPSNLSGSGGSGTARAWLDDIEIYILDNPSDIPPEIGGEPVDNSPTVTITNPSTSTYSTPSSTFDFSGTSSDDNGVSSVSWSNNRGGSGSVANDSGDWSSLSVSGITLLEGNNVITVTAQDTAGQSSTDVVSVTYTPSAPAVPQDFNLTTN